MVDPAETLAEIVAHLRRNVSPTTADRITAIFAEIDKQRVDEVCAVLRRGHQSRARLERRIASVENALENAIERAREHKAEAGFFKASLIRCYQAVTEFRGEPGTWNGAGPVVQYIDKLREDLLDEAMEEDRLQISVDWWKGRTADVEAELAACKAKLEDVTNHRDLIRDRWLHSIRESVRRGITMSSRLHEILRLKVERDELQARLDFWEKPPATPAGVVQKAAAGISAVAERIRLLSSH